MPSAGACTYVFTYSSMLAVVARTYGAVLRWIRSTAVPVRSPVQVHARVRGGGQWGVRVVFLGYAGMK